MRVRRSAIRIFLALLGLGAILYLVVIPWFFVRLLTRGRFQYPDVNQGKTPTVYGLNFEWVQFYSPDGVVLRGWFIPGARSARGTIIYCHGLNRARIEMLPKAVWGHQFGYDGLLFDFRHAGQSEGEATTLGYQERLDVVGAARFVTEQRQSPRPLIVWGVSMGAGAALMAAADLPPIDAVIADSAFLSLRHTLAHHIRLFFHLPSFPLADELAWGIARQGGFRPSQFDLRDAVARIGRRPVLFVAVEGDRRIPPGIARELYARAASPQSRLVILPGNRHGEGFRQARELYEQAVREFLLAAHPGEQ
jgi:fermentation-respiration switch protein FrsA (DUF1100 family)